MTPEQITQIAREYAEEIFKNDESNPDLSICLLNDIKFEAAADFEEKLRFLHRRFCLVEKSIILDEYKDAVENIEEATAREGFINLEDKGKKDFIESLFPEIAKEVEDAR